MLARVHILLPFAFTVPEGVAFYVHAYEEEGYVIRIFPPKRSEIADGYLDAENILIDGVKGFNADVLEIEFQKNQFERAQDAKCDPPVELINKAANGFLTRARYVTNASKIRLLDFPHTCWNIKYLNDDGTELQEEKGLVRGRGVRKFNFSFVLVNQDVWNDIHSLEPYEKLPVWKNLLLDADAALPDVGPSVVLTFTALEVFISKLLDDLASSGKINNELWTWVNGRGYLKDPSIEEKYDFLCRHLIGKSIKDQADLWEQFKQLRKARNSFAHDGIAKIGDEMVTGERARNFIAKANDIVNFIKNELPENLRWPQFEYKIPLQFVKRLKREDDKKDNQSGSTE